MRRTGTVYLNDTGTKKAVVYRDNEFNEYIVRFYTLSPNGEQYQMEADYHTDDKADAIATALYEVSKV